MKLPKLALENHQFFIIIIMVALLSGIISFINMPRSEDPLVNPPGTTIVFIYPGASPVDIEELIIDPVETAINELEDIKVMRSSAGDGLAVISVEFEAGSDPDEKYSDVVQKVNGVRDDLPEEILSMETRKWSITDVNIIQIALVSGFASYRELEKEAERLKKSLEKIGGIKSVKTWAYPEQEIQISIDLVRMARLRVPLQQVLDAIQTANQNIPGGNIDIGTRRFNIKTSGSYDSLEEIRNTIIRTSGDKILYLRDLAAVNFGYADHNYRARFNGRRAVFVTANQKQGTNIFDVRDAIGKKLDTFRKSMPPSISMEIAFDQSESVSSRVNGFFMNLLQGLILVGAVMFLIVGWRASVIVMIAIPTSIFIAIGVIDFADFGLQQMTIAGLIIALGLLVDNAIVVTENISRFIERGFTHQEAAAKGTSQIAWAVVSSTLTTVLAFIPMMMIGDVTGDFIRSMPVTVVVTLLASLLISLTLTPYLSSKFLESRDKIKKSRIRKFLDRQIDGRYQTQLETALSHPGRFIGGSLALLVLGLILFGLFVGISFFPKAEKPQFIININTPQGTSLDQTAQVASYVDSVLLSYPHVRHFATNIGQGNPQIYYNIIPENEKSNHAQIFIELKKYEPDLFSSIISDLRQRFADYPGARIEVKEFEQGPPVEAPIAIRITGDNLDTLKSLAATVENIISSTDGAINIDNPLRTSKTDLHLRIQRDKAGMLGIPLAEIDRTVRASIAGLMVSTYRDDEGNDYDITIRLPLKDKPDVTDFDKIYVSSASGYMIPLKQVATPEFQAVPMEIDHYSMERNVTLTADVAGGYSVNELTHQILEQIEALDLPAGYQYSAGGELESRQESFGGMLQAVLLAIISIFAVLVLQFRSYSQPLIIFSAIPLAIFGSVIALLITGNSFSFTAFVGFTSLVGIVVNNSIILVDYTNQLRIDGLNRREAIIEAGRTRFIPILLTTATTIGGLLPLTLGGGSLWAPMGWTIIGGLIASAFLTLMVVPVLYKLFTKKDETVSSLSK